MKNHVHHAHVVLDFAFITTALNCLLVCIYVCARRASSRPNIMTSSYTFRIVLSRRTSAFLSLLARARARAARMNNRRRECSDVCVDCALSGRYRSSYITSCISFIFIFNSSRAYFLFLHFPPPQLHFLLIIVIKIGILSLPYAQIVLAQQLSNSGIK